MLAHVDTLPAATVTRFHMLDVSEADRDVTFPFGTLLMRTLHGLPCDDPDLSWCVLAHAPS